jgi:hypothetical protein
MCIPLFASLYFCEFSRFPEVRAALEECERAAMDCNMMARRLRSHQEIRALIYANFFDFHNHINSVRFAESTHRRLLDLREAYSGTYMNFRNAFSRVRNSWRAVIGYQSKVLKEAIDSGIAQREQGNGIMIFHAGGKRGTADLSRAYPDSRDVPPVDYGPLDAAIAMYAQSAGWSTRTKD